MAGAAKRFLHPLRGPCEHVGARAHRATDENWLSGELVIHGDERVVRGEGTSGTLAVHKQSLAMAIHNVLLHLGNVVRHVVHNVHVQIVRRGVKHLGEGLAREEGHAAAIDPSVVGSCSHALQVVLPLSARDASTGKLPVVGVDVVASHRPLHCHQRVRGHLMAQPSTARVDHDAHLAHAVQAHLGGGSLVEDLVHNLDLRVVVAGAQSAQLRQAALLGPGAHLGGVCSEHAAVLLAVLLVLRPRVPLAQRPVHPHLQRALQVLCRGRDDAFGAHAHGDVVEQALRQLLLHRRHVRLVQVGTQQTHAAVDVKAHAAWRYHGLWVVHVESSHVANGEPVSTVTVWQPDGRAHNAGEGGHVCDLLHRG
mmetsp:Transcript_18384/g.58615  ORF Transcript_18384/g.58615 Transcript_18384/m.58615 type:complete len:366 (+) Transcript_18384:267-1364(+)